MNKMFEYQKNKNEVSFSDVGYVCEFFNAPVKLAGNSETGPLSIESIEELFRYSNSLTGTDELYLPSSENVMVEINGNTESISANDFIDWQLLTMTSETIYYLINKCDAYFVEFFDPDPEYEKNNDYDPETWLHEHDTDSKNEGLKFIERMRKEKPDEFCNILRTSILSEDVGLLTWLETELDDDTFLEDIEKYSKWDVMLMTVSRGKFFPYLEDNAPNLKMDDFNLKSMWVRNYDED